MSLCAFLFAVALVLKFPNGLHFCPVLLKLTLAEANKAKDIVLRSFVTASITICVTLALFLHFFKLSSLD